MVEDVRTSATGTVDVARLSKAFAALGDPIRRDLVVRLSEGDHTVGELARPYNVSVQAISKHVAVLADAGLVTKTKDGQRRSVHLEADVLDMMTGWIERYRRRAEERYRRLDTVLAGMDVRGAAKVADPSATAATMKGRAS